MCAGLVDRHVEDIVLETAICKLFCSENSWQVIDDALQIWGGEGYMRQHGLERMLRDARINRIVEGATEVMTAFVALMGMKGVGEALEGVMRSAKHPVGNFGRLASFARTQWDDLVVGHDLDGLHPKLRNEGEMLSRLTKQLARSVVRVLGKHRERILDMELIHERIATAAIDLYAMAAVISKMQTLLVGAGSNGTNGNGNGNGHGHALDATERDLLIGRSFCHQAARRVRRQLRQLSSAAASDKQTLATADAVLGLSADRE
jgi:alkylation response protein AidB-like acyl-CoA dehydrogenase